MRRKGVKWAIIKCGWKEGGAGDIECQDESLSASQAMRGSWDSFLQVRETSDGNGPRPEQQHRQGLFAFSRPRLCEVPYKDDVTFTTTRWNMMGKKTPPEDAHVLVPPSYEWVTLHGEMDLEMGLS